VAGRGGTTWRYRGYGGQRASARPHRLRTETRDESWQTIEVRVRVAAYGSGPGSTGCGQRSSRELRVHAHPHLSRIKFFAGSSTAASSSLTLIDLLTDQI
jgi:hypothetical protein